MNIQHDFITTKQKGHHVATSALDDTIFTWSLLFLFYYQHQVYLNQFELFHCHRTR